MSSLAKTLLILTKPASRDWSIDFQLGNSIDSFGRSVTLTSATNNSVTGVTITSNGAIASFPSAAKQIGQMRDFTVYWMGRITAWQASYSKLITIPWDASYSSPFTQFSLGRNNGTNGALFGFGNIGGGSFTDVVTTATNFYLLDSIPHLYAVTREGSTWRFYRDGELIESQTASTQVIGYNNPGYTEAPINICNNISTLATETTRVASVNKVGIIRRALSATELKAIYVNASGLHPHTMGWYDRHIEQAASAPSSTEYNAVNTWVRSMITSGYINQNNHSASVLKEFYLLAGITSYSALTAKLIAHPDVTGSLTFNNFVSGDYNKATGLNPGVSNTTKNILTGYIPASHFASDSQGFVGVFITSSAQDAGIPIGGGQSATTRLLLSARDTNNFATFECYGFSNDRIVISSTNGASGVFGSRVSDTDQRMYQSGAQIGTTRTTTRTGTRGTDQLAIFSTRQVSTNLAYFSLPIKYACASDLGIPTAIGMSNFNTHCNTLLSALGA